MDKDGNATGLVFLVPNVQGSVYQPRHLSKYFGFWFRKGEIINTEQRKSVFPECLDKNKKENKHI